MTTTNALGEKPTGRRYLVMLMIFVSVVITFLDRSNLSITAPAMRSELGIDTVHMGWLLSAFGWTYAFCQIPGGWLVDRVSPRVLYAAALILWSAATFFMGFAGSFVILFVLRLAVGALEAPAYPINNRVVTTWFPERERATAIGFYTSGQFVGLAFLTPVLAWLQHHYGWHMVFVSTGLLGIVWGVLWFMIYREPRQFKGANAAEIDLIQQGGGVVDLDTRVREKKAPFNWNDLGLVMSQRKLWGVYLGQFCLTSTLWFFLTWFPNYLTQEKGITALKAGFMTTVPFLAAFFGVLLSGWLPDRLVKKGFSLGVARKTPIICGLLISTCIMGANYTNDPVWIMTLMAIAFFGNGFASITWSLVSSLAPMRLIGLTGGVFNFVGGLGGITVPLVIGYLAQDYGFGPALIYISAVALLGALSYILLVGDVKRVG